MEGIKITFNFKEIHIGTFIKKRVEETNIDVSRICKFFDCYEDDIEEIYKKTSLDSDLLLRWSKLLEYDFFRLYSQHLILYSPSKEKNSTSTTSLPVFRKNIYTKNIIKYIIELIDSGEKSPKDIVEEYGIPKTTVYKWIAKYK